MRKSGLILLFALLLPCCAEKDPAALRDPEPKGPYFGQNPPGPRAELFAPGIVSGGGTEVLALFSPDGRELYYSTPVPRFGGCILKRQMGEDGVWVSPEVVSFSGTYSDFGVSLSPDGNRFYFISERPLVDGGEKNPFQDIWFTERTDAGWSKPRNVGAPVNSDARDLSPCVTADGTLYFNSNRSGSTTGNSMDIYRSRFRDDRFEEPGPGVRREKMKSWRHTQSSNVVLHFSRFLKREDNPAP